jgi:hypothetical protein
MVQQYRPSCIPNGNQGARHALATCGKRARLRQGGVGVAFFARNAVARGHQIG